MTASERVPAEVRAAVRCALDRKAEEVVVLDLRELSSATDFFVIASGRSDVQVKAIADHVLDSARAAGVRPEHVEGKDDGRWVLLDYIDYVVHVFHAPVREFYRLEALWGDATALTLDEPLVPVDEPPQEEPPRPVDGLPQDDPPVPTDTDSPGAPTGDSEPDGGHAAP